MSHLVSLMRKDEGDFIFKNKKAFFRACKKLSIKIYPCKSFFELLTTEHDDMDQYRKIKIQSFDCCCYLTNEGKLLYSDWDLSEEAKTDLNLLVQQYSVEIIKNYYGKSLCIVKNIKKNGDVKVIVNGETLFTVKDNGAIIHIYNEDINIYSSIFSEYNQEIRRASYVEPDEYTNTWTVDFNPLGIDKKVGGFKKRSDALKYEKNELDKYI